MRRVPRNRVLVDCAFVVGGVLGLCLGDRVLAGIGGALLTAGAVDLVVVLVFRRDERRFAGSGPTTAERPVRRASRAGMVLAVAGGAGVVAGVVLGSGDSFSPVVQAGEILFLIALLPLLAGLIMIILSRQRRPGDHIRPGPDGVTIVLGNRGRAVGIICTVPGLLVSAVFVIGVVAALGQSPVDVGMVVALGLCSLLFLAVLATGLAFLTGFLNLPRLEIGPGAVRYLTMRSRPRTTVSRDRITGVALSVPPGGRGRAILFHTGPDAPPANCPIPFGCQALVVHDALVQAGVPFLG